MKIKPILTILLGTFVCSAYCSEHRSEEQIRFDKVLSSIDRLVLSHSINGCSLSSKQVGTEFKPELITYTFESENKECLAQVFLCKKGDSLNQYGELIMSPYLRIVRNNDVCHKSMLCDYRCHFDYDIYDEDIKKTCRNMLEAVGFEASPVNDSGSTQNQSEPTQSA